MSETEPNFSIVDSLIKLSNDNSIQWVDLSDNNVFKYETIRNGIKISIDSNNIIIANEVIPICNVICPVSGYHIYGELFSTIRRNARNTQLNKVSNLVNQFKVGLK